VNPYTMDLENTKAEVAAAMNVPRDEAIIKDINVTWFQEEQQPV
jgi:hypothetical protein